MVRAMTARLAPADLLEWRPGGLWCPPGRFFIDPTRVADRAVVTHAHGDHFRPGLRAVLATPETLALGEARYGRNGFGKGEPLRYGEPKRIGDATVTLVPAGHVLGSAQVVIEAGGARAVVSGDYKRRADPSCAAFELASCDLFVTEATFGHPKWRHPPVEGQMARLMRSIADQPKRCHLIGAYAFGKAQRMIAELRAAGWDRPVFVHGKLIPLCRAYARLGVDLGPILPIRPDATMAGEVLIAGPDALSWRDVPRWVQRLPRPVRVAASGWFSAKGGARWASAELALAISDHADWEELTATILDTGAREILVTHGETEALCHWAGTRGLSARPLGRAAPEQARLI